MADILIRGMEMPKTCVQCDLKIYDPEMRWDENGIKQIGAWVCKRTREIIWNTQRGENCPLLPLSEGHGDLIDRDAFRADYGLGKDCENCDRNTRNCNYDICLSRMDVCGWIDDAPTIVPAEGGTDDAEEEA